MCIDLLVKYSLFLSDFNEIRIFSTEFRKIHKIPYFVNIRPVGAESFHVGGRADGHTHTTKLTVAWRNIANATKNKMVRTITVTYLRFV